MPGVLHSAVPRSLELPREHLQFTFAPFKPTWDSCRISSVAVAGDWFNNTAKFQFFDFLVASNNNA